MTGLTTILMSTVPTLMATFWGKCTQSYAGLAVRLIGSYTRIRSGIHYEGDDDEDCDDDDNRKIQNCPFSVFFTTENWEFSVLFKINVKC